MQHYTIPAGRKSTPWYRRLPRLYLCRRGTGFVIHYSITPAMLQAVPGSINKIGGISAPPLSWVLRVTLHNLWQPLQWVWSWATTRGRKPLPMRWLKYHHHTSHRLGWMVNPDGTAHLYDYWYEKGQRRWQKLWPIKPNTQQSPLELKYLPQRYIVCLLRPAHGGPHPAKVRTPVSMRVEKF